MSKFNVGDKVTQNGLGWPFPEVQGEVGTVAETPEMTGNTYEVYFPNVPVTSLDLTFPYTERELDLVKARRRTHKGGYDLEFDVDMALEAAFREGRGEQDALPKHAEGYGLLFKPGTFAPEPNIIHASGEYETYNFPVPEYMAARVGW